MNEEKAEAATTEEQKYRLRTIVSDQDVTELRKPSEEVILALGDSSGRGFIDKATAELIQALKDYVIENDGLGMSAVQLGVHKRVFVMRKPFNSDNLLVVINPRVVRSQGGSTKVEGCFSLPDLPADPMVKRASMIWVSFTDDKGEEYTEEMFIGMDARIFQHELDHLDGVLMVDTKPSGRGFQGWKRSF